MMEEGGARGRGRRARRDEEPDTGISAATESKTSRENARHSDESRDSSMSCGSASRVRTSSPGGGRLSSPVATSPPRVHTGPGPASHE